MCGDGANDCGALKAAHTGISLSEAESSVASPFTSKNPNIECVLKVIKEGRAALVTSSGIFKYIAAYSLCQFVSVMILYSLESNLTDFEFLYIDLFIISVCTFLFGKTEAYKGKLVKDTPLSSLISLSPILSLALQLFVIIFFQVTAFEYLKMQDWYEPFDATAKENKDSVGCLENYVIFTVSSFQCIILAIVFTKGKPYRASIFTNWGLITTTILLATFSTYLALYPSSFLQQQFELILPKNFHFRLFLIIYALINFLISMFVEEILIDRLVFKKLRFKCHNVNKSKRKYLAIERDLNLDTKWPVLSSEYHSAASPLNLLPNCTAEIVIETECKFDKNHVLNGLFESATATPIESPKSLSSVYESFDSASESQTISSFNMLGRSPQSNGVNNKHYSNMELNNFEMQSSVALQIDDNNENR